MKFLLLLSFAFSVFCRLTPEQNAILRKTCGKPPVLLRNRRSLKSVDSNRIESPWVASVQFTSTWSPNITMEKRKKTSKHICSGTLISQRHVITAASCVTKITATCDWSGILTSASLVPSNIDRLSVSFPNSSYSSLHLVKNIYVSRAYTGPYCIPNIAAYGDIAVIELQKDISFVTDLYPVCLPGTPTTEGDKISIFTYEAKGLQLNLKKLEVAAVSSCKDEVADTLCTGHLISKGCDNTDRGAGSIVYDRRKAASVVGVWSSSEMECFKAAKLTDMVMLKDLNTAVHKHTHWICAATGICFSSDLEKTTREFLAADVTSRWFYTIHPLSGDALYA